MSHNLPSLPLDDLSSTSISSSPSGQSNASQLSAYFFSVRRIRTVSTTSPGSSEFSTTLRTSGRCFTVTWQSIRCFSATQSRIRRLLRNSTRSVDHAHLILKFTSKDTKVGSSLSVTALVEIRRRDQAGARDVHGAFGQDRGREEQPELAEPCTRGKAAVHVGPVFVHRCLPFERREFRFEQSHSYASMKND